MAHTHGVNPAVINSAAASPAAGQPAGTEPQRQHLSAEQSISAATASNCGSVNAGGGNSEHCCGSVSAAAPGSIAAGADRHDDAGCPRNPLTVRRSSMQRTRSLKSILQAADPAPPPHWPTAFAALANAASDAAKAAQEALIVTSADLAAKAAAGAEGRACEGELPPP